MKANFILGKKQIVLASLVLVLGAAVYLNWQFAQGDADLSIAEQVAGTNSELSVDPAANLTSDIQMNAAVSDAGIGAAGAAFDEAEKTGAVVSDAEAGAAVSDMEAGTEPEQTDAEGMAEDGSDHVKYLGDAQLVSAKTVADETYFAMARLSRTKSRDEAIQTISTILDDEKLTDTDKQQATEKAMTITDVIETESRIENLVKAKGFDECIVYIANANANVVVAAPEGLTQDQATQIKNIVVAEGSVPGENISITEIN